MNPNCAYCFAENVPCDTPLRLRMKQCSPLSSQQAIMDYMMSCVAYNEYKSTTNNDNRDTLWYKMSQYQRDLIKKVNYAYNVPSKECSVSDELLDRAAKAIWEEVCGNGEYDFTCSAWLPHNSNDQCRNIAKILKREFL